ncbi:MAG: DUF4416 family protein [Desulfovibrionales bacterium]
MSTPKKPFPALLVLSVLSSKWPSREELKGELTSRLGPIEYESGRIPFVETSYYDEELGTPISRELIGFAGLVKQDFLPEIKLWTNSLEETWSKGGRRVYNLDPGLLTFERLVLATGKNFTHRIYLGSGIWADLTLLFQKGKWQTLPWTFPDYAGKSVQKHLSRLRELYAEKMQTRRSTPCPGA